ncbi:RagB/SusD family nutrient uptake outer membrane protein [Sphingobacterium psychroaquaticum]|uniref:RagB/SusD family nutrient uptake outer membrane protein n=1 Tax=Sphingobacterium psychroaquaticum TaxID=561061 RepID=UPI00106C0FE6|nr:RagB/SusD family nutrient uptake outer membrane protein [Sphingobacterium psychroaquaticum]QBQ42481.1 RagB/SusD family nutrient uptake outer membrane protein [Sphingobacterium psychroaquaticum]
MIIKKARIILLLTALTFISCKKFLEIEPIGAKFTTELTAVKSILGAWLYNFKSNGKFTSSSIDAPFPWIPLQFSFENTFTAYADVWNFQEWNNRSTRLTATEKRILDRAVLRNDWRRYYDLIGLMNLVIAEAKTASGTAELRAQLLGEAYIQRAYYFFKLLQYYAPLNDPNLGIVIHTDIYQDLAHANLQRQPQAMAYNQIISDLAEAEKLLGTYQPKADYNIMFNKDWFLRISAQFYLWKASSTNNSEDWQKAASYAKQAIYNTNEGGAPTLPYTIEKLKTTVFYGSFTETVTGTYPETLYFIADKIDNLLNTKWTYDLNVWKELYKDGDLRKTNWFLLPTKYNTPSETILQSDINPSRKISGFIFLPQAFPLRLAEQWLIWIEASAMAGDITTAQEQLQTWRNLQYKQGTSLSLPNTAKDIQYEVYLERKREFIGESDILWLDMKRFHIANERSAQNFHVTLKNDDWRYQFPIPDDEIKANPTIIVNPGWSDATNY